MLSDGLLEDKVRWYRTQATNSQLGDLIRHEYELVETANALRARLAEVERQNESAAAILSTFASDYKRDIAEDLDPIPSAVALYEAEKWVEQARAYQAKYGASDAPMEVQ